MKKIVTALLFLSSFFYVLKAQSNYSPLVAEGEGGNGLVFSFIDSLGHKLTIPDSMLVLSYVLTASGGEPISGYTWTLAGGSTYPPGVTVEPLTGILRGTGSQLIPGSYQFEMQVSDDDGNTAHQTLNFTVRTDANTIDFLNSLESISDDTIFVDTFYPQTAYTGTYFAASVGVELGYYPNTPLSWSIYSGSLPPGLVLDVSRGVIRGIPLSSDDGQTYSFSIEVKDAKGRIGIGQVEQIPVFSNPTSIKQSKQLPISYQLEQNYPNPFNPTTTIWYAIPKSGHVSLKVYDEIGIQVATLVDKDQQAGSYRVMFNTQRPTTNRQLASGVYFYELEAGSFTQVKKLILTK